MCKLANEIFRPAQCLQSAQEIYDHVLTGAFEFEPGGKRRLTCHSDRDDDGWMIALYLRLGVYLD